MNIAILVNIPPGNFYVSLHDPNMMGVIQTPDDEHMPSVAVGAFFGNSTSRSMKISLDHYAMMYLATADFPCVERDSFRKRWIDRLLGKTGMLSRVMLHLVSVIHQHDITGCQLPWNQWKDIDETPLCSTAAEYDNYYSILRKFKIVNIKGMLDIDCLPMCDVTTWLRTNPNYGIRQVSSGVRNNTAGGNWLIIDQSGTLRVQREELLYDIGSLLGEVGGLLGLFLGVSIYSFYEYGKYMAGWIRCQWRNLKKTTTMIVLLYG